MCIRDRVGALAESQQIGDADTVGITDHRRFVVDVADNQVGSLSADAGQLGQLFDGCLLYTSSRYVVFKSTANLIFRFFLQINVKSGYQF